MVLELTEDLNGAGLSIAIAVSRFNSLITERLLAGAFTGLKELGITDDKISVGWVPGSFELPYAAQRFIETGRYDAVICLGCVIKGETDHDVYINHAIAQGINQVSVATGVPTIFKVITVNSLEQALARSEDSTSNYGYEGAQAAVIMANLRRRLSQP